MNNRLNPNDRHILLDLLKTAGWWWSHFTITTLFNELLQPLGCNWVPYTLSYRYNIKGKRKKYSLENDTIYLNIDCGLKKHLPIAVLWLFGNDLSVRSRINTHLLFSHLHSIILPSSSRIVFDTLI